MRKRIFGWFNARFDQSVNHYTNSVSGILRGTGRYLVIYLLIVGDGRAVHALAHVLSARRRPGVFLTMIQLPSGATQSARRRSGYGDRLLPA